MIPISALIQTRSDRVTLGTPLRDVALRMLDAKLSSVVVLDRDAVIGIVTERDLLRMLRQRTPPDTPVAQTMTCPVHTVPGAMEYRQAYLEAAQRDIRHVVVTDAEGLPLGIVSETDFREFVGPDYFRQLHCAEALMDRSFPRLPANAPLDAALTAIDAVRGTCVVVVDGSRPLGIVTEYDIVRLYLDGGHAASVGAVMTAPTVSIREATPASEAAEIMRSHGIRNLTVVDEVGRLVGLLSEHALMRPLRLGLVDDALSERQALSQSQLDLRATSTRNAFYRRALLDNFPFPVWLKDTESRILASNRAYAEACGKPNADALVGLDDRDCWPPALAERYLADDRRVMATRSNKVVVEPIELGQQTVWHETYKAPVLDDAGTLLGTVGFAFDISDRMRAACAMQMRNKALSKLIGGAPIELTLQRIAQAVDVEMPQWNCLVLRADPHGETLQLVAAPALSATMVEQFPGVAIRDGNLTCGTAAARRERVVCTDIEADPDWQPARPLARAQQWRACVAEPILGTDGRLFGVIAVYGRLPGKPSRKVAATLLQASQLAALVIDHQERAAALRASHDTFRGIFDSISESLILLTEDGRFLDVNATATQLLGYTREQLVGETHSLFSLPGLTPPAAVPERLVAAFAGDSQAFELLVRDAHGRAFPCEIRLRKSSYFGQAVVVASLVEITTRKYAELQLEIEHDLAQAVAAGQSRAALISRLIRASQRFPDIRASCLFWRQPDGGYTLLEQHGFSAEFVRQTAAFAADSPIAQLAVGGGMICNSGALPAHCRHENALYDVIFDDPALGCMVFLPLRVGGNPVAALMLAGPAGTSISQATMAALAALDNAFGQALQQSMSQEDARQTQDNLSGLFEALQDFIFITDPQQRILHANRAVAEQLGYSPGQLVGQPIATVYRKKPPNLASGELAHDAEILIAADGSSRPVAVRLSAGQWNGQAAQILCMQDIGERLAAESRQRLAASVFENAHEGIMITDPRGRIIEINATFTELTGYERSEVLGNSPSLLKSGHHDAGFYRTMWQTVIDTGFWRGEVWNRKKSGEIFVEQLTISSVINRLGEISNFVGIFSDITLIKQHQQRLEHLAHFDALTQLPNRMLLNDRLQLAMAQAERSGQPLAVCYLDLDHFKPINDQYGHAVGDHVLVDVARRLQASVRAGDTVARLGGDEFVVLLNGVETLRECDQALGRIVSALNQPFVAAGHLAHVTPSIGVTLYPDDGADAETLLRHADQAMYAAKQGGRNRYHLFDPETDRRSQARREEILRIQTGMAQGEFRLYYQPKVNMREGCVIGVEALIRWQHPERGLLLPEDFLPVIEGSETAIALGNWVIDEALRQMEVWQGEGNDLPVSINIAPRHLQEEGFVRQLGEALARHPAIAPGKLELEVLESAALDDITAASRLFDRCQQLGVRFALDDFGAGYSSLNYFRRLPAETLKVDQSFIRDMLDDPEDLAIVEGVIGLTRATRRQVIAEGVETVEHGLVLLLLGCDLAQGFGIAHPMPAEQLNAWVSGFLPDETWALATAFKWTRDDLPLLIAEVEHQRWRRALLAYLDDATGNTPPPPLGTWQCRFGQWYDSADSRRYAQADGYKALAPIHERLHALGRQLVEHHHEAEAEQQAATRHAFELISRQLSEHISQLQAEVLLNLSDPRS